MSRIGKNPVVVPPGVEVSVAEQIVVKGPLGTLKTSPGCRTLVPSVTGPSARMRSDFWTVKLKYVPACTCTMSSGAAALTACWMVA